MCLSSLCLSLSLSISLSQDLKDDLIGELTGNFEKVVVGLLMTAPEYDAYELHNAIQVSLELHSAIQVSLELHSAMKASLELHSAMKVSLELHSAMRASLELHSAIKVIRPCGPWLLQLYRVSVWKRLDSPAGWRYDVTFTCTLKRQFTRGQGSDQ